MKKLILFSALFFSVFTAGVLFNTSKASAATAAVVDRSTIKIGEQIFFDADTDDNFNYEEQNPTDGCADIIKGFDNDELRGNNTPDSATLYSYSAVTGSSACSEKKVTVTFTSATNFQKAFVWVDKDTISGSDGKLTFTREGSSTVFVSDKVYAGLVSCSDTLAISSGNTTATLVERKGARSVDHDYDWYPFTPGERKFNNTSKCWEAPAINGVRIAGTPEDGNDGAATGSSTSNATNPDDDSCESNGAMSWILCPVIEAVSGALNWVDTQVQRLLFVDQNKYADEDLYRVWTNIRNIASFVLVIIMLIMVIGSATGTDFVDAYTVKKAFPRMVAAIIFMTLSWYICIFLIGFFNAIGAGVMGLMTAPFRDANGGAGIAGNLNLAQIFDPSAGGAVVQWSTVILVGVGAAKIQALLPILLSFLTVGLLALGIAFLVLIARQMVIITLVLFSPLAILAWIFPGNDKLWKVWWDTFMKLLFMFPIIMALLAAGRIFAYVIGNVPSAGAEGALLNPILKFSAYVIPFFLIPFTFKAAGGLFGNLVGMVNDRSRGVFDRLRTGRQKNMSSIYQRGTSSGVFQTGTKAGRFGNKVVGAMFEPHNYAALYGSRVPKVGQSAFGKRASHIMSRIQQAKIEATQKVFQHLNENDFNDKAYSALTGVHHYTGNHSSGKKIQDVLADEHLAGKAPQTYEEFMKFGQILSQSDDETERIAGRALQGQAGYLATYMNDPETNSASLIAAGAMGWAQHGFSSADDLAAVYNTLSTDGQKGQTVGKEMAGALVSRAQFFGQDKRLDLKMGYGVQVGDDGRAYSVFDNPARMTELIGTFNQGSYVGAKAGSILDLAYSDGKNMSQARKGGLLDIAKGTALDRDGQPVSQHTQKAVREAIIQGASFYGGGDPDAKKVWLKLAEDAGLSSEVEQVNAQAEEMRRRGGTPGGTPGAGANPGSSPLPPGPLPPPAI